VCKFLAAVKNGGKASTPSNDVVAIDISTDFGKEAAAAKQKKRLLWLIWPWHLQRKAGIIVKSMSSDWPEGLAHRIVVLLSNKYNPDNRIARVELRSMLNRVSMRDAGDLIILLLQVSAIKNRYDTLTHQIDKELLIAVVRGAAAEKYLLVSMSEQWLKDSLMILVDLEVVIHQ
jgi:hypothetical protein